LQEDIPAALLYITNWVYIVREVPYFEAFGRPPLLQQLWSLAVEEQFYLLWPLILLLLLRTVKNNRFGLLVTISIMIALSSIWMANLYRPDADPLRVYYGTDTRAAGFLVGALLAMVRPPRQELPTSSRRIPEVLGWSGLVALLILYNQLNEFQPFLYRGGILVTALSSALLILGASSPITVLGKLLETRLLRWIGSRSYSIYLWHWPVFMLTRPGFDLQLPELFIRVGQVAVTFGLAELSYRWIETPVRHHGFRASLRSLQGTFRRWPVPRKLGLGAGVVSASLLLVWQSSIHQVTNQVTDEIPTTTIATLVNAINIAPTKQSSANIQATLSSPADVHSTLTPTPAVDVPRVTLIGDSIMQGATPMIEDILGKDIYIDAARKRRMEDVPALVETLYREGHLSHVVVIHLGSNRPFEDTVFDEVMKELLAHQVERVIFINVHRPIGWEYYINKKFVEDVARWPQAELIDWNALAQHEQGWFITDQTHLTYYGSKAYVAAIKDKLVADK
jgi:peptidoglycan/LPS O-acetylase OafA/YrhL